MYVCYVLECNRDNQSTTYRKAYERIRCVRSGRSKKLVEITDGKVWYTILFRQNPLTGLLSPQAIKWLWLEGEHCFAMLQIDRHRVMMVHDQPLAVDLTEAGGPTQPEIGLLPIVHGSA